MKKRPKNFSAPAKASSMAGSAEPRRLAVRAAASRNSADASLEAVLQIRQEQTGLTPSTHGDWAQKELTCARAFNFELPNDPTAALDRIEEVVRDLMNARQCALLSFNEQTGVYTCLDDVRRPGAKVRELTRISDWFLQELFGNGRDILHSYLLSENGLTGLIVLSEKANGEPFDANDQILLDLLSPYLAVQLDRLQSLQETISAPYIQHTHLMLASKLVTAVDEEGIFTAVLDVLAQQLPIEACQYVSFNPESGKGEVLYEVTTTGAEAGQVQRYNHAGLESKRRSIPDYANLVGLLGSAARNRCYLQLSGKNLGERSLEDIFGLRGVQSALLLPITNSETGEICGTLNLFHTTLARISDESREIAIEAAQLASGALSRAFILENALAMASSDELTGLINRRGYYQRFEAELERARRHQTPLCVALIDVDHFKKINDRYGHLSGDLILKTLADLFSQNMRKIDVVCRFGGEEFAILLPDTPLKAAIDLMERVRQSVASFHFHGVQGEPIHATVSIGLAEVDTKPKASRYCSDISDALALADEQLYAAKNSGRNRVCYQDLNSLPIQDAG